MTSQTSHIQGESPKVRPANGALPEIQDRRSDTLETPVGPWQYLVRRRHTWRMQLYLKGVNMTAWQLVRSMKASGFNEQQAAEDYDLPVEAVREAVAYVEKDRALLDTETEIERLMLKRGGVARGPEPVS